jgi:histidine triad (HIT) family protein
MNTEKTIFEQIINNEIPSHKICDSDNFSAFLDIFPRNQGHTLVVPKKPYRNINDIPDELMGEMMVFVKKLSSKIQGAVEADGIKLIMNNGKSAGQIVFHAHVHIIPCFDDVDNNINSKPYTYADGEADDVAKKIRDSISSAPSE